MANQKITKIAKKLTKSDNILEDLKTLGTGNTALSGSDFKEWKETFYGEHFTWDDAADIVGLTVRRCTSLAGDLDAEIPERVSKIVILSAMVDLY